MFHRVSTHARAACRFSDLIVRVAFLDVAFGRWFTRGVDAPSASERAEQAQSPSDKQLLAMVAEHLSAVSDHHWRPGDDRVDGPGHTAVVLGPGHPCELGDPRDGHLDLTFILDTTQSMETAVVDCVVGLGATSEERITQAIHVWATTTAKALLEVLDQRGDHATYLAPDAPNGFPGWHTIHAPVIGWGTEDHQDTLQSWVTENALLPVIAIALTEAAFDRPDLIGIKIFLGSHGDHEAAEVRVNGQVHDRASIALQSLGWPRVHSGASYARTFVLLVEPAA